MNEPTQTIAIAAHRVGIDDRRGRPALIEGLSLELIAGRLTAIAGFPPRSPSALLRVLAGLRTPDRGSVWAGYDGGDPRAARLRSGESTYISGASRPRGWERLSVGSRRRERRDGPGHLAAARQVTAIEAALRPELLTLFADLDPAGERESLEAVAHWVRSLRRTAVVTVTDPRAAIAADRVLVLGGGRLVGDLDRPERPELASVMELAGSG